MAGDGRHPYQPLPDNGQFSGAHFTSQFWNAAALNAQHYYDTRCRCVAATFRMMTPTGGLPDISVGENDLIPYLVFDAFPGEEAYKVQVYLAIQVSAGHVGAHMSAHLHVRLENEAGGNQTASERLNHEVTTPGWADPVRPANEFERCRLKRLDWPSAQGQGYVVSKTPWMDVAPSVTLGLVGRIMRVTGYRRSLNAFVENAWIWGVVAVGYRNGL